MSDTWVALGLGNPGERYASTRHNVGRMVIEAMADAAAERFRSNRKVRCDVAEVRTPQTRLILAAPHSYMNESGGPTSSLLGYFSVPAERLIVLQDEVDLPFGGLRLKFGGGDNGHNGLRSIRQSLGSGDWYRVRLGVGRGRADTAEHVLARFSRAEAADLADLIERGSAATESLMTSGLAAAQNEFNT